MAAPVAFAVDKMLGRLARWLRLLGHDAAYGPHLSGRTLADCARREGRLLLTRDTRLVRDPDLPPHVFVTSDHFREQLRQIAAAVPLGDGFLKRCADCNRRIEPVAAAVVRERVPPYVLASQARFLRCPGCGRVFWNATHRTHIVAELESLGLGDVAREVRNA